ncbi:sodium pump decarboxylase gamma subunit [Anaerosacchariphilus polymeriproducens]|uniref:Sodium pump decarboxylase gamma subunit n=1 Tax=Anaerosacchariphilus polymeriproducens TaxID=1812858 RepID=A0A371AT30_9FIRM|nr:sodium pump decarboxylase gamma subunit [Anaerosacchariphilus polymeriproducens]RDU22737.1 sodium pump decarboxylase gamma subunit [Anaerosacchariphilus polymeriproducens]
MNIDNVLISLDIMWKGMLGIFTVIILIMILVMLLTKFTNSSDDEKKSE